MPYNERINLEPYLGSNCEVQENEVGLDDNDGQEEEVDVDMNIVNELL
jgi:hypothetical protein